MRLEKLIIISFFVFVLYILYIHIFLERYERPSSCNEDMLNHILFLRQFVKKYRKLLEIAHYKYYYRQIRNQLYQDKGI